MQVRRGDIFYADLSPVVGSEQGGTRPVLILQNDIGNQYSPTTIVAAITSQIAKAKLPTHVEMPASPGGLEKDSVILLEQIRTIDKSRLMEKVTSLNRETMQKVNHAVEISLGLVDI
ncbi:type II toxin-antitoxin system PemK/MazF family toxin [Desulfofundulus thermosubterraneus]|uniref:mRNA interferase n=1 Tax=Desulfofundulus thermosubterraneus DSM 16057 TaxID=1121432 RepID=A0A1M6JLE0_9FIRM|nr:type II toxin-antitoxin system PemK/MazF family toxin [Desulfofundulus thermosubterraneus]SHJ47519.1 mRNA interferase MazF [Desulfofundulus thermosubterraneus DSM 16057]